MLSRKKHGWKSGVMALHAHKLFRLTRAGEDRARELLAQVGRVAGSERLAIVDYQLIGARCILPH